MCESLGTLVELWQGYTKVPGNKLSQCRTFHRKSQNKFIFSLKKTLLPHTFMDISELAAKGKLEFYVTRVHTTDCRQTEKFW